MRQKSYPYRVANWTKRSRYSYLAKLGNDGIAWEFLRRRPDYQQDWDELQRLRPKAKSLQERLIASSDEPGDEMYAYRAEAARRAAKWHLLTMVDPYQAAPRGEPFPWWQSKRTAYQSATRIGRSHPEALRSYPETFEFYAVNLALPMQPQLSKIMRDSEKRRKARGIVPLPPAKERFGRWPHYIRALDAEAAGIGTTRIHREIGKHLTGVSSDPAEFILSARSASESYRSILATSRVQNTSAAPLKTKTRRSVPKRPLTPFD